MTYTNLPATNRLLKLPSVIDRVSLSKTEIYRRIKAGAFPAPIKTGVRAVAFLESDIDNYITQLSQGGNVCR